MEKSKRDRKVEKCISTLLEQLKEGKTNIAIRGEQSSGANYILSKSLINHRD